MKIVHALGWYFPESLGGTEVYVQALCRRQLRAGHEVRVAAPAPGAQDERRYLHDGAPVFRYPTPAAPSREECQALEPARGAERFHAWLAEERPDVVHFHTFTVGLGVREVAAARRLGARTVATNHLPSIGFLCQRGTLMRWGEELCDGVCEPQKCAACELQHRGLPRPLAALAGAIPPSLGAALSGIPGKAGTALGMSALIAHNRRQQRQLIEELDRFVLLNRWVLEAVAANGIPRSKLGLNRLGYGQEEARPKPGPGIAPTRRPVRLGYLGRYVATKGLICLAKAFASLPREAPLTLELRGPLDAAHEAEIVREVREILGGDPRVRFEPPVPNGQAPGVLAGYDVLVCPSIWFENGPTVAVEAEAVGTPVVGSRIGGLAETIADGVNGRLFEPGDWRGLAAILGEIAADPAGTVDRWRQAYPPARSMDDVARDYLALYEELVVSPFEFSINPCSGRPCRPSQPES